MFDLNAIVKSLPGESTEKECDSKRPIWLLFNTIGNTDWLKMSQDLMSIDSFSVSIDRAHRTLQPLGFNLIQTLIESSSQRKTSPLHHLVSTTSIQVALVDCLRSLGIQPSGFIGLSAGELVAAYADNCISLDETILSAYHIGRSIEEAKLAPSAMALVELKWQELQSMCPPSIVLSVSNWQNMVTISGPKAAIEQFVSELKRKKIWACQIDCCQVAYNSYYMSTVAPQLRVALENVIQKPRIRSAKWVSTLVEDVQVSNVLTAEYFVNNLVRPCSFYEVFSKRVPKNALVIDLSPPTSFHTEWFDEISKHYTVFNWMKSQNTDFVAHFWLIRNKLRQLGVKFEQFKFDTTEKVNAKSHKFAYGRRCDFEIELRDGSEYAALYDHAIDMVPFLPHSALIKCVWEALAQLHGKYIQNLPVLFEDIHFSELMVRLASDKVVLSLLLTECGSFKVFYEDRELVRGLYSVPKAPASFNLANDMPNEVIEHKEIYDELRVNGYCYSGRFKSLQRLSGDCTQGEVNFVGDWVALIDSLFQFQYFRTRGLQLAKFVRSLHIDPSQFNLPSTESTLPIVFESYSQLISCGGIQMSQMVTREFSLRIDENLSALQRLVFVPHVEGCTDDDEWSNLTLETYLDQLDLNLNKVLQKYNPDFAKDFSKCPEFIANNCNGAMLDLLRKLANIESKSEFEETFRRSAKEFQMALMREDRVLFNSPQRIDYFKSSFDTVIENFRNDGKLTIVEFSALADSSLLRVAKAIGVKIPIEYLLVPIGEVDENLWKEVCSKVPFRVQRASYDFKWCEKPQWADNSAHICLFSNSISHIDKSLNTKRLLTIMDQVLKEGGFVLVDEFTRSRSIVENLRLFESLLLQHSRINKSATETIWERYFASLQLVEVNRRCDQALSCLYLLRRPLDSTQTDHEIIVKNPQSPEIMNEILTKIQEAPSRIFLIFTESMPSNSLIESLQSQPGGHRLRFIFISDTKQTYHSSIDFIKRCDLIINVYHAQKWGCYRRLIYAKDETDERLVRHARVHNFKWTQAPEPVLKGLDQTLVNIGFASMNLQGSKVDRERPSMEFSGYTTSGERVMGIAREGSLATSIVADRRLLWAVPADWSLQGAATVPYSYAMAYYVMMVRAGALLKKGECVLVNSAEDPVAQAVIRVALHLGCRVYLSVQRDECKRTLLHAFEDANLEESAFLGPNFERHLMRLTKGAGADVVLNFSSDLAVVKASVRCVDRTRGRFVNFENNQSVPCLMGGGITVHYVQKENVFGLEADEWSRVHHLVEEGVKSGVVRPFEYVSFEKYRVGELFNMDLASKGLKTLLEIGADVNEIGGSMMAEAKMWLSPYKTYVITGELSGVEVDLAEWLCERGARKVLLACQHGFGGAMYARKLELMQMKHAAIVSVCQFDVRDEAQCVRLVKSAVEMSEEKSLGGVFHLIDARFDEEKKYLSSRYLDHATRQFEDCLFMVVSSGIVNYSYVSSPIERLCEARRAERRHGVSMHLNRFARVRVHEFLAYLERVLLKQDSCESWLCNFDWFGSDFMEFDAEVAPKTVKTHYLMPNRVVEKLNLVEPSHLAPLVVIHPIEGHVNMLTKWASNLKYPVYGVQFTADAMKFDSVERLAEFYWREIDNSPLKGLNIHLCGYQFGAMIAHEMAATRMSHIVSLTFLDGAQRFYLPIMDPKSSLLVKLPELEAQWLGEFISQYAKVGDKEQLLAELISFDNFDQRVQHAVVSVFEKAKVALEPYDIEIAARAFIVKMLMAFKYRAKALRGLPELLLLVSAEKRDQLKACCDNQALIPEFSGELTLEVVDGNEKTFLDSSNGLKVAQVLMKFLSRHF